MTPDNLIELRHRRRGYRATRADLEFEPLPMADQLTRRDFLDVAESQAAAIVMASRTSARAGPELLSLVQRMRADPTRPDRDLRQALQDARKAFGATVDLLSEAIDRFSLASEVAEAEEVNPGDGATAPGAEAAAAWRWLAQFRAAGGTVTFDPGTDRVATFCAMEASDRAWELHSAERSAGVRAEIARLVRAEAASRKCAREGTVHLFQDRPERGEA